MRDTMDMARESGPLISTPFDLWCERFAKLVRADERNRIWTQDHWTEYERILVQTEREACAKVCEEVLEQYRGTIMGKHAELVGDECAGAIRNRRNT